MGKTYTLSSHKRFNQYNGHDAYYNETKRTRGAPLGRARHLLLALEDKGTRI